MPVPTVASLCATLGHHLVPAAGFEAPATEVTAVHISELLEPGAYLSGGELLLTTGLALPADDAGCTAYVERVRAAGVSALALGLGPVHRTAPASLVHACRALGVPLLVVPAATPFLVVSRAYWTARSRTTERRLHDVVTAHRSLVEAATAPDPATAVLGRLARWLDGWAVLLDADGEVALAQPDVAADELQVLAAEVARLEIAGVHSSASFVVGERVVVVFPLAVGSQVVGFLAAGGRRQMDAAQRQVVHTAVALLSLDAVRRRQVASATAATRRCVALLLDLGLVDAARRLAAVSECPPPAREVAVLVVRGRDTEVLLEVVERWCPGGLGVLEDRTSAWFFLPAGHGPVADLRRRLDAVDPSAVLVLSDLVAVEGAGVVRARLVQEAQALEPGASVDLRRDAARTVAAAVDRFVAEAGAEQAAALVAFLRHRGHWGAAADALGLHRNTLRYRVDRAVEVLGLDLDDPDVAAETWLALRDRGLTR
ncbi:PucR family transcriptional regulator [Pimelobacter simplex]|uniref:PucR family transcriptional regulator n=1 Tax=Nocardioides simplex TaxID=2045 RepID=UPI00214FC46B|nr:PucR family transcriptional regulator [Pimelobacter simplex]UUW91044.1 PucR family transcriptional regulator [Pimelobacter simplex]UUW94872.1 PucR family transcriptional regulator [Pimelobacter simplex]